MLYPLLIKRIINRIRYSYEELLLTKEVHRDYDAYSKWLDEYLELDLDDQKNIIKKFERSQTASIIYAMRRRDREIFINQLGVFYIKATTIDFYNAFNRMVGDKQKGEYDYESIKQSALEECRELFIKRANNKRDAHTTKNICFKI